MVNMHLNYKLDVGQLQDRYICQNKRPGLYENALDWVLKLSHGSICSHSSKL